MIPLRAFTYFYLIIYINITLPSMSMFPKLPFSFRHSEFVFFLFHPSTVECRLSDLRFFAIPFYPVCRNARFYQQSSQRVAKCHQFLWKYVTTGVSKFKLPSKFFRWQTILTERTMAFCDVLIAKNAQNHGLQYSINLQVAKAGNVPCGSVLVWYVVVCVNWLVIADSEHLRRLFMWIATCEVAEVPFP